MATGTTIVDEQQAIEAALATLGDRRLREGIEPFVAVERRGQAFEITLKWANGAPSVFVVARDGTVAVIVDGPTPSRRR